MKTKHIDRCRECFGTGVTYTPEYLRWFRQYQAIRTEHDHGFPHTDDREGRAAELAAWLASAEHAAINAVAPHIQQAACLACRGTGLARPPQIRRRVRIGFG
jgi:hypothetical protein